MAKYPPYMNAYGKIRAIFDAIRSAEVPDRFTYDFLETYLEFKSSSDKAIISLLKGLGLLTQDGVPTQDYKDFRHKVHGPAVLARAIKRAYKDLFLSNEFAYKLSRDDVEEKVRTRTGAKEGSVTVASVAGTFDELCRMAEFEGAKPENDKGAEKDAEKGKAEEKPEKPTKGKSIDSRLGLAYTINLNLPPTTNIEVFNAIFKSLKEHLLSE